MKFPAIISVVLFAGVGDTRAEPLEAFQDCDVCPEMIELPVGSFTMGAPLEESAYLYSRWYKVQEGHAPGFRHEGPQHEVQIDIPFAMGRNEVTWAEWRACVAEGGCSYEPHPEIPTKSGWQAVDGPRMPVIDVSYNEIQEYLAWLNSKVGANVYRLPTEAEWEYAARAGTTTKFAQGDTLTIKQANIGLFTDRGRFTDPDPNNRQIPIEVDALDAANAWGLRHMAGNVNQQTMACFYDRHLGFATTSAYLSDAQSADDCNRVVKGGAFGTSEEYARPAHRGFGRQTGRSRHSGFRVLKELSIHESAD